MPEAGNPRFLELLREALPLGAGPELDALATQHGGGTPALLRAAIDTHLLPKDRACALWGDSIGVAHVDPLMSLVSDEAIARIPLEIAQRTRALPIYVLDGTLTVAMADPTDTDSVRRIGHIAQCPVSPVFSLEVDIAAAIAIHYATEATLEETLQEVARTTVVLRDDLSPEELQRLGESAGVVQLIDALVHYAIRERATDIHLEPQEQHTRVRFRVDGALREVLRFPKRLQNALATRLKIICQLDISESRLPQDGRFSLALGTSKANFRVSTIPTQYGEKAVVRVLASTGKKEVVTLDNAMISQSVLQPFRRLINSPNGILFVTGPTGSGKTTTLYAALHELNHQGLNISTIEDPIEIQLAGVNQTQVNADIGLTFAAMLRSLLRQDPDVILLGEIRDGETAKIATEAALTGHLVLATLHTNSAPQAIARLVEMGVAPHLVAPTVLGVLSQRLAPRLCEKCKESYVPPREVLRKYFEDEGLVDVPFYRGRGCPACRNTGFRGRIAYHELVVVTEEMRGMIADGRSAHDLTGAARRAGYRPLRYDGLKKVLLGLTTIEQIDENTAFEWAT